MYDEEFAAALEEYRRDGAPIDDDDFELAQWRAERAVDELVRPFKEERRKSLEPQEREIRELQQLAYQIYQLSHNEAYQQRELQLTRFGREREAQMATLRKEALDARKQRLAIWQRFRETRDEAEAIAQLKALTK